MMKRIIITAIIALIGFAAHAQFNYPITTPTWYKKVRVDSVFWLNTVDTVHSYATLYPGALMSRTTAGDTSLYLANGSRWVRIGSGSSGSGGIDSAWRSNDTLYFRYSAGGTLPVAMDYSLQQVTDVGNTTTNSISITGSDNAPSPAQGLQLSYNSGGRIEAANPSTGDPTPLTVAASTVFMDDAVIGPLTTTGNAKFTGNGTPGVGKVPVGTDGTGNWTWNGSIWDSTTIKSNNPIDTVQDIATMQAYTGKAKILLVKDPIRSGLFFKSDVGTADEGTTFAAADGNYWVKMGVEKINLNDYGFSPNNSAADNTAAFAQAQSIAPDNAMYFAKSGVYQVDSVVIDKAGYYNLDGVEFSCGLNVQRSILRLQSTATKIYVRGLTVRYTGQLYYETSSWFSGTPGVLKIGAAVFNPFAVFENCEFTGMSHTGIEGEITNEGLTLLNCISHNNGYAGASSTGKDFTIIGGQYYENGGGNAVGDGYGIYGNVRGNGDFKVIGVTAWNNMSRNFDSHGAYEAIISNNFAYDAGRPNAQWGNTQNTDATNYHFVRRLERGIITNNISKNAYSTGFSINGQSHPTEETGVSNVIVDGNISFADSISYYVRPRGSENITVSNNQSLDTLGRLSFSLLVSPVSPDPSDTTWLNRFRAEGNIFDSKISISLLKKSSVIPSIAVNNNTCSAIVMTSSVPFTYSVNGNNITGGNINITGSAVDSCQGTCNNNIVDSYTYTSNVNANRPITITNAMADIDGNLIKNAVGNIFISTKQNFRRNKIINANTSGSSTNIIQSTAKQVEISDNEIIQPTNIPTNYIRFTLDTSVAVYNNKYPDKSTAIRIDLPGGTNNQTTYANINPGRKVYDAGFTAIPAFTFSWKIGDVVVNSAPGSLKEQGWIALSAGTTPNFRPTNLVAVDWQGTGSPEGVVTALVGARYTQTNGGAGTCLWVKETGTGNTGWIKVLTATSGAPITGGTGYIQNQSAAAQANSSFWTSGTGRTDSTFTVSTSITDGIVIKQKSTNDFSLCLRDMSNNTYGRLGDLGTSNNVELASFARSLALTSVNTQPIQLRVNSTLVQNLDDTLVTFNTLVAGVTPTQSNQLTTKIYVDTVVAKVQNQVNTIVPYIITTAGSTALTTLNHTAIVNNAAPVTITLPTAASVYNSSTGVGRIYVIKKISGAALNVTVQGSGSENIDGVNTKVLTLQYSSIIVQSDGTQWHVIGAYAAATVL